MSDNFAAGDVVVCVDDSLCTTPEGVVKCPWKKGEIARVGAVSRCGTGLSLLPKKGPTAFVVSHRFRKLPPASDEFTRLIRSYQPHKVEELA